MLWHYFMGGPFLRFHQPMCVCPGLLLTLRHNEIRDLTTTLLTEVCNDVNHKKVPADIHQWQRTVHRLPQRTLSNPHRELGRGSRQPWGTKPRKLKTQASSEPHHHTGLSPEAKHSILRCCPDQPPKDVSKNSWQRGKQLGWTICGRALICRKLHLKCCLYALVEARLDIATNGGRHEQTLGFSTYWLLQTDNWVWISDFWNMKREKNGPVRIEFVFIPLVMSAWQRKRLIFTKGWHPC